MDKYLRYAKIGVAILLICNSAYSQSIVKLVDRPEIQIDTNYTFFADTNKIYNKKNILKAYAEGKFNKSHPNIIREEKKVYWLHIFLQNKTDFDREWILDFHNWSYVNLYECYEGEIVKEHNTGHLFSYNKRDYKIANKSYVLLSIKSGEIIESFVRLESKFNNELKPETLNIEISPRYLVDKKTSQEGVFIFSFLAIFLFMLIYMTFIFVKTKLKSYAFYLLVILIAIYHTSYNTGYIIQIFGFIDSFPIWLTYFETISSNLFGVAALLFINEFFKVRERYPKWAIIINKLVILLFISGFIAFINVDIGLNLSMLIGVAVMATTITISYKSTIDNYPSSFYILIGYLALCIFTLINMLCYLGVFPKDSWMFYYSIPLGCTIEIIFFSFALANMLKVIQQENESMKLNYQQEIFKTQLEIQEQTLQNIGSEIHDNIGQVLGLIKLNLHKIESLCTQSLKELFIQPKSLLDQVIEDLRNLSKTLNPDYISKMGLAKSIEQQLNILENTGSYSTQLEIKNEITRYEPQRELVVFRVVQELLNNIVKHAEASSIFINIIYQPDQLVIRVQDNGKGFIMELENHGQGLRNIFRRIKLVNGSINFDTQLNIGTTVIIILYKKF